MSCAVIVCCLYWTLKLAISPNSDLTHKAYCHLSLINCAGVILLRCSLMYQTLFLNVCAKGLFEYNRKKVVWLARLVEVVGG